MAEINVTGASALYMKVDITEVSQNVAGNSSTVKFVASMRQTSGNNWNQVPGVDFKVIVNGSTLANQTGFFLDVRGNITQVFYTGNVVIPHNTDGTKSFSWSFWFDPKGTYSTYKPTTLSGTHALSRIARVSNSTLSANNFDFGQSITVYTNQTDPSFTHTISYIKGSTVVSLATAVKTSKAVAIPTSEISNYTTATTASMKIRTSTYSGATLIGNYDLDVTVTVPSTAVPTIGAVSFTGSNAVFTGDTQFIASKDRLKATVANVVTSYSSPIKTYLYRVQQRTTFSMSGTTNAATFPTFNFPATGSEVVNIQMAVVDARGRQSAWSTSAAIRVHAYQPPSIGAMTITRNANVTTVNVKRNWSVTPLYENGSTSAPKNTGALVINYRTVGNTTWASAGGSANGLSGVNSNVALTPSFAGGNSYEFEIKLTDKFQTTTAPIIRIGTEFVPLDIGPKGIGVGKIHSDGARALEVGTGGIGSDGPIISSTLKVGTTDITASGAYTRLQNQFGNIDFGPANASYAHIYTDRPSFYFNKELLVLGHKVWHANNDGSGSTLDADLLDGLHASSFMRSSVSVPTITSGTNANGNWYNINGILLICWYRFSITGRLTASQMNGSWTYPMPYAFAPAVSIGGRADNDPSSTNGYRRAGTTAFNQYNESTTKTDILYAVNNGDVPATGQQKFLNIFAMGTPA